MQYEGLYITQGHEDRKEELMFLQSPDASLNYENAVHRMKEN